MYIYREKEMERASVALAVATADQMTRSTRNDSHVAWHEMLCWLSKKVLRVAGVVCN